MIDFKLMSSAEVSAELGSRLKSRRLSLRMTQRELAQRASLSVNTINNLEAKTIACTLDTIVRASIVLGLADHFEPLFATTPKSIVQMERAAEAPRLRARRSRRS
jgi:transcriptional regulator with XRE-family HTH domain